MKKALKKLPFYNEATLPYHFLKSVLAASKYHYPAKNLTVIAVTGTNGKTSTSFMIWKMLNSSGRKTGLMTTVAWGVDHLKKQYEHMTTVDANTLNSRIAKIAASGAKYLVLEVTSHALAQFRTFGVPVDIAVFTNLTSEHLDYHKTLENYRNAKRKLFKKAKFGVINADDKNAKYFKKDVKNYSTYGIKSGDIRAKNITLTPTGVSYEYSSSDINDTIKLNLPGEFNVYNSLAAISVGEKLGLKSAEIKNGLAALTEVEGRMNSLNEGQPFDIIIDYAHTPDALEKVFEAVKNTKGKIISVHGGAGRRDESTRSSRGKILGKYSDIVIITEDDSRDEDPEKIAKEFLKGAESAGKTLGKDLFLELDRKTAIKEALIKAKKNDLVLILGKGHEKTILRSDGPHPFEDKKVVKDLLRLNS